MLLVVYKRKALRTITGCAGDRFERIERRFEEILHTMIRYLNFLEGSIPGRTRAAQTCFIPSTLLPAKNSSDSPNASFHSSALQLLQFQSGEGLALLEVNALSIADWAFPSEA